MSERNNQSPISRRQFLTRGSALVAGASLLPGLSRLANAQSAGRKPNIVVVVADDVTHNYLGCYGGPTPTPHLDRLAQSGVRFNNAHCTTAVCNPSRYSLLTGQYAGRNPNTYERWPEDEPYWLLQSTKWTDEDPSIARTMGAAGYRTGYVGKWHSNFELGTDLKWPEGADADDPEFNTMLRQRQQRQIETVKDISGFDYVSRLSVGNLGGKKAAVPAAGYHNPEWQTEGALEFIEQAARGDQPFFLHLANTIPHSPSILESLEQDPIYTVGGKLEKRPLGHPPRKSVLERLQQLPNQEGPIASINAGMMMLDDQMGALQQKLDDLGIADNTMVIWLADHSIYGKGTTYSPGTHVPMMAAWPGHLPEGGEVSAPVSLVDLFRTCAAAGGAELPDDEIDGKNLLPLMRGETKEHDPVYTEVNWFRGIIVGNLHYVAFRPPQSILDKMESGEIDIAADQAWGQYRNVFGDLNAPFKPAYFEPDQLYDLEIDPFERNNLADNPAYADEVAAMKNELAKITETFERPFPLEVPAFMKTDRYAALVQKRKKVAEQRFTHYPEPYDAERIYNLNLKDPLAD